MQQLAQRRFGGVVGPSRSVAEQPFLVHRHGAQKRIPAAAAPLDSSTQPARRPLTVRLSVASSSQEERSGISEAYDILLHLNSISRKEQALSSFMSELEHQLAIFEQEQKEKAPERRMTIQSVKQAAEQAAQATKKLQEGEDAGEEQHPMKRWMQFLKGPVS